MISTRLSILLLLNDSPPMSIADIRQAFENLGIEVLENTAVGTLAVLRERGLVLHFDTQKVRSKPRYRYVLTPEGKAAANQIIDLVMKLDDQRWDESLSV